MNAKQMDSASLWMLGVIGMVVIVGGVLQFRSYLFAGQRSLYDPIRQIIADVEDSGNVQGLGDDASAQFASDLQTDTDGDGLSDFHEKNVSNTNPYVADSDSDGISDSEELAAGTNPNCAEGQPCEIARTEGDGTTTEAERAFADLAPSLSGASGVGEVTDSPEEIRALLIQQGVPEESLADVDDQTLIDLAQEAALESAQVSGTNTIENLRQQGEAIKVMSSDKKRGFLIESGVAASDLDQLSDEEIDILVDDAVDQSIAELTAGQSIAPSSGGADEAGNADTQQ